MYMIHINVVVLFISMAILSLITLLIEKFSPMGSAPRWYWISMWVFSLMLAIGIGMVQMKSVGR